MIHKTLMQLISTNKNTPEFNKAIEYLKNGGNIATIEGKYKMTKEVKEELTK